MRGDGQNAETMLELHRLYIKLVGADIPLKKSEVQVNLNEATYWLNRYSESKKKDISRNIERTITHTNKTSSHLKCAELYAEQSHHSYAINHYTEVLHIDPVHQNALSKKGFQHLQIGQLSEAFRCWSGLVGLDNAKAKKGIHRLTLREQIDFKIKSKQYFSETMIKYVAVEVLN